MAFLKSGRKGKNGLKQVPLKRDKKRRKKRPRKSVPRRPSYRV